MDVIAGNNLSVPSDVNKTKILRPTDQDQSNTKTKTNTAAYKTKTKTVVKVVLWSRGGSPDEARLEQTPYPFQPH